MEKIIHVLPRYVLVDKGLGPPQLIPINLLQVRVNWWGMWEGRQRTRTGRRRGDGEERLQLAFVSLWCQSRWAGKETTDLPGLATAGALKDIDDPLEPLWNESRIAPRFHWDQQGEVDWSCQE